MGNESIKIPNSFIGAKSLTDTEKIFLIRIFNLSEEKGFCCATDEELAKMGGYSTRTVRRMIQRQKEPVCFV